MKSPFKKLIIPHLDKLTPEANETQSVNTVYLKDNKIIGHNTDIDGFMLSIKNLKLDIKKKKVFVFGGSGLIGNKISKDLRSYPRVIIC